ncbi:hypothetical protein BCR22_06580 [Enterococcus plantarum]|uniref:hypothetical protein n=1 Tax=Enterococcus plantarum TaxID=1077675 RepID=UPI00084DB9D4|nr:hypothetical protein [Enterococcus plantarum]OEG10111.1 hypothetical protein BCR22_06580 [Enterococcus plantarum]
MKKSVKSSVIVLALGLGLSIGTSEEAEAMYESPYSYFNDYGIREKSFASVDKLYTDRYQMEVEQLHKKYNLGVITDEEFDIFLRQLDERDEKSLLERETLFNTYGLVKKDDLKQITHFDTAFDDYSSLAGVEQMPVLETIQGEGGSFNSFRELGKLNKLKTVNLEANNQLTLNSFKKLTDLETLVLSFNGFENKDESSASEYTQALTTDISALSHLDKLKELRINARGRMATITLKKGTTSYQLFDPIVSSIQFEGAEMNYVSTIESSEVLEWNNLSGKERYLAFSWRIEKGTELSYTGEGQIPIRWKE